MGGEYSGKTINKVVLLDVNQIEPNPFQPRKTFNEAEIDSLAVSIISNGLLQPLTVRRKGKDSYELISGERRLRALKLAEAEVAPCIIVDTDDSQSAVFALLENLQREDLNCFEEAAAMQSLINEWGISQQELGIRLGKAQSTIANKLRLLRLDDELQQKILNGGLNERQARALLKIENRKLLENAIDEISSKKLNVTQTERYIEGILSCDKNESKRGNFHPIVKDVRIFFNTITNAVMLMNQSGIKASSEKRDYGDHIEYIVKIPRTGQLT